MSQGERPNELRSCVIFIKDCEDGSVDLNFDFIPAIDKDGALSPAQSVAIRLLKVCNRISEAAGAIEGISS